MLRVVPVRIEILSVPDCPNRDTTDSRVRAALARRQVTAAVRHVEVATAEDAARLGMNGSPTILIDGRDPFDGGGPSLSCRLYQTDDGLRGSPTIDQLVDALL